MLRLSRETTIVWLLGLTQIIGYGTLYYSFSILAADIAAGFGWSSAGFFGFFSLALVAGGFVAPSVGRAVDRYGAARVMSVGSLLSSAALCLTAFAPTAALFVAGLVVSQVVSALVLYDAAFPAVVQASGANGQRRIVHLTLVAGFASSIFWPLTSWLDSHVGWRDVLLVYAGLNLLICLPIHLLLAHWRTGGSEGHAAIDTAIAAPVHATVAAADRTRAMILVTLGFALSGFALSAVLSQMVPLLDALGFAGLALAISTLFGPAQVAVRFTSLVFGAARHPLTIAILGLSLLPLALFIVALSPPVAGAAIAFVVLTGLCSGLKSIVQGTVPLALFGREGFGARLGLMASARYVAAALAPFAFAALTEYFGITAAVLIFATVAAIGVLALVVVLRLVSTESDRISGSNGSSRPA